MDWQFLKDFTPAVAASAAVVAAFAALRPELTKIYDSLFRRGKIEVKRGTEIQLGFNRAGPTSLVTGSLIAEQQDCLLTSAELIVERKSDNAKRRMTWAAFGTGQISGPYSTVFVEPRMVRLLRGEVFAYQIGFKDISLDEELSILLGTTNQKFRNRVLELRNRLLSELPEGDQKSKERREEKLREAFPKVLQAFRETEEFRRAVETLRRALFWQQGVFKVTLIGHTKRKSQNFSVESYFVVDDIDYDMLIQNVIRVSEEMLDVSTEYAPTVVTKLLKDQESELKKISSGP